MSRNSGYLCEDKVTHKKYIAYHRDQRRELYSQGKTLAHPVDDDFNMLAPDEKPVVKATDRLKIIGYTD